MALREGPPPSPSPSPCPGPARFCLASCQPPTFVAPFWPSACWRWLTFGFTYFRLSAPARMFPQQINTTFDTSLLCPQRNRINSIPGPRPRHVTRALSWCQKCLAGPCDAPLATLPLPVRIL
ncbi:Hypothetical predicted protein [Drosophila guanche]|uniref:Uncharacterized protein n=1 Tax=Drosophila guanche TaxID=7266 RepID=A0A3B0JEH4_DROGU|nr:Hypothetical predicted protein [Drosophila guanche]